MGLLYSFGWVRLDECISPGFTYGVLTCLLVYVLSVDKRNKRVGRI